MNEKQARLIIALADNNMNVVATANQLFFHRNTVSYQLSKLRKQTGKDPTNFYDLCELVPIARAVLDKADRGN